MADLDPRSLPMFAALRKVLDDDRVVRTALSSACESAECPAAVLAVECGGTALYVLLAADAPPGPLPRATGRRTELPELLFAETHIDVTEFPDPAVTGMVPWPIRAYAAVPLQLECGRGTMLCLDEEPRAFSLDALDDLQALAVAVSARLSQQAQDARPKLDPRQVATDLRALKGGLGELRELLAERPDLMERWLEFARAVDDAAVLLQHDESFNAAA